LEHRAAFHRICDEISALLLHDPRPSSPATHAAARATRDLAAAFARAAGRPQDPLWYNALGSLERFLDLCEDFESDEDAAATLRDLRGFLDENADLLPLRSHMERAS